MFDRPHHQRIAKGSAAKKTAKSWSEPWTDDAPRSHQVTASRRSTSRFRGHQSTSSSENQHARAARGGKIDRRKQRNQMLPS
jgi:hypothetical protein